MVINSPQVLNPNCLYIVISSSDLVPSVVYNVLSIADVVLNVIFYIYMSFCVDQIYIYLEL